MTHQSIFLCRKSFDFRNTAEQFYFFLALPILTDLGAYGVGVETRDDALKFSGQTNIDRYQMRRHGECRDGTILLLYFFNYLTSK